MLALTHPGVQVQVIPWLLSDSNFVRCSSQRLDPNKTVFVGALHGRTSLYPRLTSDAPPRRADGRGAGHRVPRPVRVGCVRRHRHRSPQVPHRQRPRHLLQRQVLHEGSLRRLHRDQNRQVHQEGAGRPLPGGRALLLLHGQAGPLLLQVAPCSPDLALALILTWPWPPVLMN